MKIVRRNSTNFQNTCKLTNKLNLMKKLLFSAMALSMVFFSACEKDETTPDRMLTNKQKSTNINKSTETPPNTSNYSALDSMAMAAGVETINPIGNGYELSFYNNPETYTVEIVSFNDTLEIEYLISSTSGSSNEVTIDVTNENFNIESVGNISFNTFAQSPISESRDILERITAVTTVHHILNTDEADDFDDNGGDDVYPDDIGTTGKFWGRGPVISFYAVNEIECGEGSVGVYGCRDRYRFWINFGPGKDGCGNYCI